MSIGESLRKIDSFRIGNCANFCIGNYANFRIGWIFPFDFYR